MPKHWGERKRQCLLAFSQCLGSKSLTQMLDLRRNGRYPLVSLWGRTLAGSVIGWWRERMWLAAAIELFSCSSSTTHARRTGAGVSASIHRTTCCRCRLKINKGIECKRSSYEGRSRSKFSSSFRSIWVVQQELRNLQQQQKMFWSIFLLVEQVGRCLLVPLFSS